MVKIPKKIKDYKVIVDNKHRYYGTTDDKKKTVIINRKKSLKHGEAELKDTILHEKMHVLHPQMYERNVEKAVEKKEHKTTPIDIAFKGLI